VGGGETDDRESIRAIQAAVDAGVTLIDTAPAYGFGHSEEIVGRALCGRRDKVVLATKCGLCGTTRPAFSISNRRLCVRRSLEPRTLRIELKRAWRRLGTDHID
jgi:methylglyoxal reductase